MSVYCEVCGGPLSIATKNRICGDACRAKRSRDKRQARKRAYAMGTTIVGWQKLLNQEAINTTEARKLMDIVWQTFGPFYRAIQDAEQRVSGGAAVDDDQDDYDDE